MQPLLTHHHDTRFDKLDRITTQLHSVPPRHCALVSHRHVAVSLLLLFALPLRFQLDALAKAHPTQFKLWYTIDRPSDGWKYDKVRTNDS